MKCNKRHEGPLNYFRIERSVATERLIRVTDVRNINLYFVLIKSLLNYKQAFFILSFKNGTVFSF